MNTPIKGWLLVGCVAVALAGVSCSRSQDSADPDVLAVYDGGKVSATELDRVLLARSPSERIVPGEDATGWYSQAIREVVIDRLLLQELEFADEELVAALDRIDSEVRRRVVVDVYLENHLPPPEPIDEDELRRFYRDHQAEFSRPERRQVQHLFRRRTPGVPEDRLEAEMAGLRQRIIGSESFAALATEYSESESRHSGGSLGWLSRDQMTPDLAAVIFSLEPGVPSEALLNQDGAHLFLVVDVVEAKSFGFEDVRSSIEQRLQLETREEAVLRLAANLPRPAGAFVVDVDDLRFLLGGGDDQAEVLRMGDYTIRVAEFRSMLMRVIEAGQPASPELSARLLELIERRERIHVRAVEEGAVDDAEVIERFEAERDRERLNLLRRRAMSRYVDEHPDRVQAYYDANKLRFSSPLRLEVSRLVVPLDPATANSAMAALEALRSDPSSAGRLQDVAARFGGTVEELGWRTLPELARFRTIAAQLAAELGPGQVSAPYRTQSTIEAILVTDRQDPQPIPLASVYDDVVRELIASNRQQIYRDWADQTLDSADFRMLPEHLQEFVNGSARSLPLEGAGAG